MSSIFQKTDIKGLELNNRLVRSATWEGMCAEDGSPTGKLNDCYAALAAGGVGLIISGYTYVRADGKQFPGKMGIDSDALEPGYRSLMDAVHKEGGKLCVQLVHAGGQALERTMGKTPVAPSAIEAEQYGGALPEELQAADIADIIDCFGKAAGRSKNWGVDAVQLHAAHGYLINQFLSPHTNKRADTYGGSAENRRRFLMEAIEAVRGAVGKDFPVLIKLGGADNLDSGLTADDALNTAKALADSGIDAIEVSGGTPASGEQSPVRTKINAPEKEGYNLENGLKIKAAVSCPVMSVGGFRSLGVIEKALAGGIDYVSLSRPLVREPGLPNRWKSGDTSAAKCISCNGCFKPGLKEGGIYCVVEKKEKEKQG